MIIKSDLTKFLVQCGSDDEFAEEFQSTSEWVFWPRKREAQELLVGER
jgi:hypothetical protein